MPWYTRLRCPYCGALRKPIQFTPTVNHHLEAVALRGKGYGKGFEVERYALEGDELRAYLETVATKGLQVLELLRSLGVDVQPLAVQPPVPPQGQGGRVRPSISHPYRPRVSHPFKPRVSHPYRPRISHPFKPRVSHPYRPRISHPFKPHVSQHITVRVGGEKHDRKDDDKEA